MRAIDADAFVRKIRKQYCEDCVRRKGIKNGKMQYLYEIGGVPCRACEIEDMLNEVEDVPTIQSEPSEECERCMMEHMDAMEELETKLAMAEPHWIPMTEDTPDEERECWITPKITSKVYRGVFTRHYSKCHRTGFICDEGFMWLNTALAWMYCEVPEPYKGVTE